MAITEFKYNLGKVEKGYNNRTLYIDLSNMKIASKPVSKDMKEKFIGGRGFDLWLLWNALPKDHVIKWDDPENELCVACGPLGGTPVYPGSGKSRSLIRKETARAAIRIKISLFTFKLTDFPSQLQNNL